MSSFEENVQSAEIAASPIDFSNSEALTTIARIEDGETLFTQLQRAKDIPAQFLPESAKYCLVATSVPEHTGELSEEMIDKITAFARAHIVDPERARWLLVHTWPVNSLKPQSTLVCFVQHFSPNALVDNTEGAGVANQIIVALQSLQGEGLVTTNLNYELIRKMSKQFGVLFGGSFTAVANSLRVHSVDESVKKSERVAREKGLFSPTQAPTPGQRPAASTSSAENLSEDEK